MNCSRCTREFEFIYPALQKRSEEIFCWPCSFYEMKKSFAECDHKANKCDKSVEEILRGNVAGSSKP